MKSVSLVLVDSYAEGGVTHIRRKGKELHVRDTDGTWSIFDVDRFPKGWADVLPVNMLVEVDP